ncbi:MAG: hypothetical protein PHF65_03910, partial [Oscillospiraceae bacterium]|nr:hypothetical protein [Oscillospiraceae bacterium]
VVPQEEPLPATEESEDDVTLEEIRFSVQDKQSLRPTESFIDHSILKAAILKERERQIREQIQEKINGTPIFKPLPVEPEPEPEFKPEEPEPLKKGPSSKRSPESEGRRPAKNDDSPKRPIWDEPMKDLWRDQ